VHVLSGLLAREAVLLAILAALGAGAAAVLSERFDAAARLGMAPVLGFCLGTCVMTTLLYFLPANETDWVVAVLAVASLAFAAWRTWRPAARPSSHGWLSVRDVMQLALVCAAVAGPLTYVLHEHHTVGPAAYYYTDVDNYVAYEDGIRTTSITAADRAWSDHQRTGTRFADIMNWYWAFYAQYDDKLAAGPLDANVDSLLGLGATQTNSPFMIVLLLMGALGAFSAVRYLTQTPTWMAALAGAMFGGAFFLELWFDTWDAALVGLGLIIPIAVLFWEVLRSRRVADLVVFALVFGCLFISYQVFAPVLGVAGIVVLAFLGVRAVRVGRPWRPLLRDAVPRLALVVLLAVAFDLVGVIRTIFYYGKLLRNELPLPRVGWQLPIDVVPGWLAQTREFWYLPGIGSGGFKQFLLAIVVPGVFLCFILVALRRYRQAVVLVLLAALFAVLADYEYVTNQSCTYCGQRQLLPLAPIIAVLVPLGLAAVLAMPQRWAKAIGALGVVLVVGTVGERARVELQRFSDDSYFLDSANRGVLAHLPRSARAVQLEGYGLTLNAQAEQPLIYYLVDEAAPGRASIIFGTDAGNAIQYLNFGVVEPPGPEFHPDYDYVLTRFGGIRTDRRVIARSGPIALEQRTQALDVMPESGFEAPLVRLDTKGTPWVVPGQLLTFVLVGPTPGPVWARLTFTVSGPVAVTPQAEVRTQKRGSELAVCVPATGSPPTRDASLTLSAPPVAPPLAPGAFPPTEPTETIALTAMQAIPGHCTP
jgi:hypothetical protein